MAIPDSDPGFAWAEASIKANAPASSGVYAIYNTRWLYVGESNDIRRRLLEHYYGDNPLITGAGPTGFAFETCNALERIRRQAALIAQLAPTCNQMAR